MLGSVRVRRMRSSFERMDQLIWALAATVTTQNQQNCFEQNKWHLTSAVINAGRESVCGGVGGGGGGKQKGEWEPVGELILVRGWINCLCLSQRILEVARV